MATVFSVHNSDGCVGRCDAKCHEAKHEKCACVCGGCNHGVGGKQALSNMVEYAHSLIEQWEAEDCRTEVPPVQLELGLWEAAWATFPSHS